MRRSCGPRTWPPSSSQGVLVNPLPVHGDEDAFIQVIDGKGEIVTASSNLRGVGRIARFEPDDDDPEFRTGRIPVPDEMDDSFRIVGVRADSPRGPVVVYVVANLDRVSETSAAVRGLLIVGLPIVLLVVAVTSWVLVGRVLRPVEAIRAEVSAIGARDLDRRVPEPATDDEIGRLARTMNDMLGRLQASSAKQRRFVADASHELQSPSPAAGPSWTSRWPIRSWRWEARRGVCWPTTSACPAWWRTCCSWRRPTTAPTLHARCSSIWTTSWWGRRPAIARSAACASTRAASRRSKCRGDPDQLARVVRNLLDNAERHAPAPSA